MASPTAFQGPTRHNILEILLGATLCTSAIHFVDNALHLEMYPEPAWFTRSGVLVAWLVVPILAFAAYRSGSRAFLAGYGLLGFAGFAHYFPRHLDAMPWRCLATILAEAIASAALIVYVLFRGTTGLKR